MPEVVLPFELRGESKAHRAAVFQDSIYPGLSEQGREACRRYSYLAEYLAAVPPGDYGPCQYHARLSRSLQNLKHPNVVYPVSDGVFTHIFPDVEDERNTFISIEPGASARMRRILVEVDRRLLEEADSLDRIETDEDKKQAFLDFIDRTFANGAAPRRDPLGLRAVKKRLFSRNGRARPGPEEMEAIKYLVIRDKIGMGVLDAMVRDPYVEDISCSGLGTVFLEHKIFGSLKTTVIFSSHEDLDGFILRLAEHIKKPVSVRKPIVDATLPDGSRINIVYGRDVSKRGSNFSIRKFSDTPLSIVELIELGTLDYRMAAYLSMTVGNGMNVFVCGETASGKTTLLNAVTTFIHPNAKIVSIEDTPELQVPHKNWIRQVVQTTKQESENEVTMFDLLKAALRQRPNEIIIGEIRGPEGLIAFQAMQTGHSCMATFHAATVERLIQRLTGSPINVPKTYIDNLNVVVIQSSVKLPNGRNGRRALSIAEIVGYDPTTQSFSFVEVFHWVPSEDRFLFYGEGNSYLLERKIAIKLGIPPEKARRIYSELDRRAKILEKLHKEQGVTGFYELLRVLAKAQREGLF